MPKAKRISNIIYPELFNTQYICVYDTFNEELKEMIEKSGYKLEFITKYRRCLRFLDNLKENCIRQKSFEKLKECENLYSIRLIGKKNIRILFTIIKCSNKEYAILLYSFQEKDSKKGNKTSYNSAIEKANNKIKELIQ